LGHSRPAAGAGAAPSSCRPLARPFPPPTQPPKKQGILSPDGRRAFSKLIFTVFTPALTFDKLAPALSWANLVAWLPLPLNVAVRRAGPVLLRFRLCCAQRQAAPRPLQQCRNTQSRPCA
jgi:hypothetical protein